MLKTKKGQLYIFAAIIICAALALLFQASVSVSYDIDNERASKLCDNYEYEASILINDLIRSKKSVLPTFKTYTDEFFKYSKTVSSGMGSLVFSYIDNKVIFINHLGHNISIELDGISRNISTYPRDYVIYGDKPMNVSFEYGNETYFFDLNEKVGFESFCINKKGDNFLTVIG